MEAFLGEKVEKKGLNKGFVIGIVIGVVVIAAVIGLLLSLRPSVDDQKAKILEGLSRAGTPEFDAVTKDIIISTDDRTVESPNGFGRISMFIVGKIRNKGTKTINALEVNVAVIDQLNAIVKEKNVLVVPTQREKVSPGEIIPITLSLDGFDKKDDRANIRWKVIGLRAE
jgi:hypothetical protein